MLSDPSLSSLIDNDYHFLLTLSSIQICLSTNLNTILFSEFNTPKNPLSPVNAEWISLSLSPVAFLFKPAPDGIQICLVRKKQQKSRAFPKRPASLFFSYASLFLKSQDRSLTDADESAVLFHPLNRKQFTARFLSSGLRNG